MRRILFGIGLLVAIGVGVVATVAIRQRQRLGAMSDDEIRDSLAGKLAGRVPDEQLAEIQNAVIAKVRGSRWSSSPRSVDQ